MRVPDSTVPVLGIRRVFLPKEQITKGIRVSNLKIILKMGRGGKYFKPGEVAKATCVRIPTILPAPHASPSKACTCGIYAWNQLSSSMPQQIHQALVMVLGWGRVFHGTNYWRAEYVKPLALLPIPERIGGQHSSRLLSKQYVHQSLEEWQARVAEKYNLPILGYEEIFEYAECFGVWPPEGGMK